MAKGNLIKTFPFRCFSVKFRHVYDVKWNILLKPTRCGKRHHLGAGETFPFISLVRLALRELVTNPWANAHGQGQGLGVFPALRRTSWVWRRWREQSNPSPPFAGLPAVPTHQDSLLLSTPVTEQQRTIRFPAWPRWKLLWNRAGAGQSTLERECRQSSCWDMEKCWLQPGNSPVKGGKFKIGIFQAEDSNFVPQGWAGFCSICHR